MVEIQPETRLAAPANFWGQIHALAGSLVVHSLLLIVLGLLVLPQPQGPREISIDTQFLDPEAAEVVSLPLPELSVLSSSPSSASAPPSLVTLQTLGSASTSAVTLADITDEVAVFVRDVPAANLAEVVGAGPSFHGTQAGANGTGAESGTGDGAGLFFGLKPIGDRTVFVVDASQSMNHPYPGPEKTRFKKVKLELIQAIGEMQPEQKFFIMFFNDVALPMPANRMMEATPATQQYFLSWIANVPPGGKTNPADALLLALQLQPDTIYLLTDGDIPLKVGRIVRQANQGRVAIHTIGFGDNIGEKILKEIAEQNGGEYRFIPESDATITSN